MCAIFLLRCGGSLFLRRSSRRRGRYLSPACRTCGAIVATACTLFCAIRVTALTFVRGACGPPVSVHCPRGHAQRSEPIRLALLLLQYTKSVLPLPFPFEIQSQTKPKLLSYLSTIISSTVRTYRMYLP